MISSFAIDKSDTTKLFRCHLYYAVFVVINFSNFKERPGRYIFFYRFSFDNTLRTNYPVGLRFY